MKVSSQAIRTLFQMELRMVLRDRRILLTSILLPLLTMPLMFAGSNWTLKKRAARLREATYRYALTGPETASIRPLLPSAIGSTNTAPGHSKEKLKAASRFEEVTCDDPNLALQEARVDVVLEAYLATLNGSDTNSVTAFPTKVPIKAGKSPPRARSRATNASHIADDDAEQSVPGAPVIRIIFRADRDLSSSAATTMGDALRDARRSQRAKLLREHGFPVLPMQVAAIVERDIASKGQVAGLALGRSITLLLLLFILTSGAVVATDSLAGEKERGTLETLLTTSARRADIIGAKLLVILAVALTVTVIQTGNLLLYVGLKLMPVPPNFAASVTVPVALLLFVLFLPVAALAGSVLLLISGYAKSYKEAQMYFFPVFLLGLVPALAPLLPGLSLHSILVLVPVANIALCARDILIGSFDWPFIGLSWLVTAAAGGWTASLTVRSLSAEKLITASDADAVDTAGGAALFSRHVLRWFAVLWAVLLIVNNYLEKTDLRVQLFINLIVLFFGASCLMLRWYRLDVRETLSLRLPKPAVWLAVLIAVPSGLIAASGLFRLANYFVPISSKMMEQFDQAVIPPGISFVQLLFFLSIMPGIFEEITFRGLLLHGLRRRFPPVVAALLVGIMFGLFHVALFRFAPTAMLGIMLAAVTMLTGSIFPAMLWHALSNAASVFAYQLQTPLTELDPLSYLLGSAMLALSFWIIWRNRTPHPGIGTRSS
jgi:sodium transport system permease protein